MTVADVLLGLVVVVAWYAIVPGLRRRCPLGCRPARRTKKPPAEDA